MVELNEQTIWILGRPNFACKPIADFLRISGHEIKTKSEDEQAAVIHWMLCLYEKHGDDWKNEGNKIIKEVMQLNRKI